MDESLNTRAPSIASLVWVFTRFGNFTFGGGSATVATLQHEIVDRRQWLHHEPFHLAFALSRLTPGTNLLAFCTAAGWLLRGWFGGIICLLAASIPCSAMAVALTAVFTSWSHNPAVNVALRGAIVAAVGVMLVTGVTLIRPHWKGSSWVQLIVFVGGSFALNYFLAVPPIRLLIAAAIAGWLWPSERATK